MRRLLVAVVAVTLLPACGSFFRDRSLDYVKAESTPPLTLPQDVDTRPIKPLYPIPPASGKPVSEPAKAPFPPGMKGVQAAELPPLPNAPGRLPVKLGTDGNGVPELRAATAEGWVNSLAWVVMPDHLHWLVELRGHPLAVLMRRIKGRSARALNVRLGRQGPVWQAGYHDRALRHEEALQDLARYVVANPLRAGLAEKLGDYPLWDAIWV